MSNYTDEIVDSIMETEEIARKFGILDYMVFAALMLSSALIGVYFAFFAKQKQNTMAEYLMGGKTMPMFPIVMSLVASYVSGVSLLGVPAEIYTFGTQYGVVIISEALVCIVCAYFFMPVFYRLQLFSSFEYLVLRYDNSVRVLLSVLYCIMTILYTPLLIYMPALAFSHVSGMNLYVIEILTCCICVFYTSLGGLKAVVWTDTIQSFAMISGVVLVAVIGTIDVGGISVVLQRATDSNRLEFFNMDPNPLVRHTFWTVVIGNFFMWLAHLAANQAILQRCLALPSFNQARRALLILAGGISMFVFFSVYTGLVIFAKYHNCDPVSTKAIRKVDQILPFTVMDLSTIPGFPGLFIAGVFSAALRHKASFAICLWMTCVWQCGLGLVCGIVAQVLATVLHVWLVLLDVRRGTMSTMLNSMSGVILQDFIRPCLGSRKLSESQASNIMKVTVVVMGIFCVCLTFIVDRLGAIIQVSRTISGLTAGAMLGIFVLGMTVPWLNAKGALIGGISSLFVAGWVGTGSQQAITAGTLRFEKKPMSVDGCTYFSPPENMTLNHGPIEEAFWVFRISYLYLTLIGFIVMVIVSAIVTCITGPNDPRTMNRDLLCPAIHRFLPAPLPATNQNLTGLEVKDRLLPIPNTEESNAVA